MRHVWNRTDYVCEDLTRPPSRKRDRTYTRYTEFRPDQGTYHVRIISPEGVQRMEGVYLDSTLNTPHGPFTYYHPNGRPESAGHYLKGYKNGEWSCWSITGEPRFTRTYHGLPWDQLQFVVGAADLARTLERDQEGAAEF